MTIDDIVHYLENDHRRNQYYREFFSRSVQHTLQFYFCTSQFPHTQNCFSLCWAYSACLWQENRPCLCDIGGKIWLNFTLQFCFCTSPFPHIYVIYTVVFIPLFFHYTARSEHPLKLTKAYWHVNLLCLIRFISGQLFSSSYRVWIVFRIITRWDGVMCLWLSLVIAACENISCLLSVGLCNVFVLLSVVRNTGTSITLNDCLKVYRIYLLVRELLWQSHLRHIIVR